MLAARIINTIIRCVCSVKNNSALQLVDDGLYKELLRVQSELQKSERFCFRCLAQLESRPNSANSITTIEPPLHAHDIEFSSLERASNAKKRCRPKHGGEDKKNGNYVLQ